MVALLLLLSGCPYGVMQSPDGGPEGGEDTHSAGDDTAPLPTDSGTEVPPMDAVRLLTRVSLDLRGVRPTDEEYDRVIADPEALEALVDEFLQDERWPERIIATYGEVFYTLTEAYTVDASDFGIAGLSAQYLRSIGEEPLRVLATVAEEDRPYYELVTADWTMANEILGQIWPLDYPADGDGWQKAHYTDGRPAAGILSTNGMWWRYGTTASNANRKRANAISRILLCNDYFTRPIDFTLTVNLLDSDALISALKSDPACVACHNTLDPLGSYLYGFYYVEDESPADLVVYHPDREQLWTSTTGVAPGYYGTPGYSLTDLSYQIANDPRFASCAVETAWELLSRREVLVGDMDRLTAHREAFLAGGVTLRALFRSLIDDPMYRADATSVPEAVPSKLATPELLASQVAELTGFRWTSDNNDMMETDTYGFRVLAGGVDGVMVTRAATASSATAVLVQQRLAEFAGRYAADAESRISPDARRLFREIDFGQTPDEDMFAARAQVRALYLRVLGRQVEVDSPDVDRLLQLWADLYDVHPEPTVAWGGVLTTLLRDPDFVLY